MNMLLPNSVNGKQLGFTLIEVLVSLFLFAIIMSSAFQLFNTLTDNNTRLAEISSKESKLILAWSIIFQDIYHIRNRVHRDALGGYQPAIEGTKEDGLRFIRGGLPPVAGVTPGGLQRVLYRSREGQIQRLAWPVLDLDPASEPDIQVLLSNVESWEVMYLTEDGVWIDIWPIQKQQLNNDISLLPLHQMPRMIEITINFFDGSSISKKIVGLAE